MSDEKTLLDMLAEDGISLPPAAELDDEAVTQKLWQAIDGLAERKIYLMSTNHLSDRELYQVFLDDLLLEPYEPLPDWGTGAYMDVIDTNTPEGLLAYLTFYADDETRGEWTPDDLPGDLEAVPEHRDPAYDRDSKLPTGTLPRSSTVN